MSSLVSNLKPLTSFFLHVDGDSFFVACEAARFPHLAGKPVVVGEERGIAVAMSKEAKKLGVTRGFPIFKIKKFYPEVIILPSHFELYQAYSERLFQILSRYIDIVEKYSIDECFALLQADSWQDAEDLVSKIKHAVQGELGITFSFGLGRTKVLAKIASKAEKPDGLTIITPGKENLYLKNTPIGKIWGIGYRTAPKLIQLGIADGLAFKNLPFDYVRQRFTKPFIELWQEINGVPCFHVGNSEEDAKSLQATRTFPATRDLEFIFSELSKNIEIACMRLRNAGLATNMFSVFLKTSEYKYLERTLQLAFYTDNPVDILNKTSEGFNYFFRGGYRFRSSGVTLQNLRPIVNCPQDLFGNQEKVFEKSKISRTVDLIREKYGTNIIFLGGSMRAFVIRKREGLVRSLKDSYIEGLPVPYLGEVR